RSAITVAKSFPRSKRILARNAAPVEDQFEEMPRKASLCATILKHERAGESANFRASVFHPGGSGWEVRSEARKVRGRKNARYRRCDEDRGHAKGCGAGGA